MNLTTFLWTLTVVLVTVVKILVTILVTTIKTILVRNDWLWTQGWNALASLLERVLGPLVEWAHGVLGPLVDGANLGVVHLVTTLLHDLTTCLYAALGCLLTLLTKLMTLTYYLVRYMITRCRDLQCPHAIRRNITEEKALTIHDLS